MNNFVDEDELDAVKTTAQTSTNQTQTAAPATAPATLKSNVASWDADDEDESVSSSILKSTGLPFIKVTEGNPVILCHAASRYPERWEVPWHDKRGVVKLSRDVQSPSLPHRTTLQISGCNLA